MAAEMGELVLVLGDLHMPHRAADLPAKFKKMLVPNKMQHVLCTGNLCTREQLDELKLLAPNVHVVKGDFDEDGDFPEEKVITIGKFRIGLIHGHQIVPWGDPDALATVQRRLGVDLLVSGHTHKSSVVEYVPGKVQLIDPGSITGAFSFTTPDVVPSFILMAVKGNTIVTYVYELSGDDVMVQKAKFVKREGDEEEEEEEEESEEEEEDEEDEEEEEESEEEEEEDEDEEE
eukprot:PLAT9164.10.p1 GENE.PLAT9164.10~~PLAT9164.10.p1  ORF type:complete len:232 (+),score=138.65 PLAT9164.10:87-782(+)